MDDARYRQRRALRLLVEPSRFASLQAMPSANRQQVTVRDTIYLAELMVVGAIIFAAAFEATRWFLEN